ncbi:cell division protein FtsQ/DivIB [Streptococcus moroccensis]|uniref:Cell division protein FtsQ n=1 Tax=Streptococcus moroccensis TaxID=1451356 RepID=A0ABT9YNC2_9STRE|nr:FtsQ-type POTRA domain-containing protein [Streptococcus moroccensis]MDQ0221491.1 cell division protein FtsQ [Streptococcus moroccensis]
MSEKDTSHEAWGEEKEQESSKTIDLAEWLRKNHAYLEKRAREKAENPPSDALISDMDGLISESDSFSEQASHGMEDEGQDFDQTSELSEKHENMESPELVDLDSSQEALNSEEEETAPSDDTADGQRDEEESETESETETDATEEPEEGEELIQEGAPAVADEALPERTDAHQKQPLFWKWGLKEKGALRLATLVLAVLLTIVFAGYFVSPLSKVKTMTVEGQSQVSAEDILANTGIYKEDYTLTTFFKQDQMVKLIEEKVVWVKDAAVSYQFPTDFKITVEEHQVIGYVKDGNIYHPVLSSGDVLDSTVATENLPSPFLTFELTDLSQIKEFIVNLSKLEQASPLSRFLSVKHTPTNATEDLLTIETVEGHTIMVPLSEVAVKLPYYEKVIKDLYVPSYIDMEVGIFTYAK